jgi:hypothetical protein
MVVVILGVASVGTIHEAQRRGDAAEATESDASAEIAKLRAELDQLRGRLPDHSHVMKDVGYHFTNLWFAAKAKNWPLAKFYLDEPDRTCGGLCVSSRCARRAVVISTSASFSTDWTALSDLQKAVENQDARGFPELYRRSLVGCYSCHQAAEKPYLRPRIPEQPEVRILTFDPNATGP